MAFATAVTTPVAPRMAGNWGIAPCDYRNFAGHCWYEILRRPEQDICLEDGEFQVISQRGLRYIGRWTGRTRQFRSFHGCLEAMPTAELYRVDTVVEYVGDLPVLVGRRGDRLDGGTWHASPEAVA